MKDTVKVVLFSVVFGVIAACGGGGGSAPAPLSNAVPLTNSVAPSINAIPTANAGPDRAALVDSIVTLDGGASTDANGDSLSYKWTFSSVPPGSRAALVAPANVRPTFNPDLAGIYVASLIVNDSKVDSAADTVTITVSPKPPFINYQPIANAGPSQVVPVGSTVVLTGVGSVDPGGDTLGKR